MEEIRKILINFIKKAYFFPHLFAYMDFFVYLCRKFKNHYPITQKGGLMLGVKSRRNPITGDFAQNLRDQIRRYETGQLNEEDRKRIEFLSQPCANIIPPFDR